MTALIWAAAALAITGTIAFAGLKAWRGWLDLKRFEQARPREALHDVPDAGSGMRIEMADLKERLRKLEAIAQGVDL